MFRKVAEVLGFDETVSFIIEVGLLVNYGNVLVKSVTLAEANAKKKIRKTKFYLQ